MRLLSLMVGHEAIPDGPEQRHDGLALDAAGVHDLGHDVLAEDVLVDAEAELAELDDEVEDLEEAVDARHDHPHEDVHLLRLEHLVAVLLDRRVPHPATVVDLMETGNFWWSLSLMD